MIPKIASEVATIALRTSESEPWVGTLDIDRRFVTIAAWCREVALPAAVFGALVTAGTPANNVYSLAAADVGPVARDIAPPAIPVSNDLVTATITPEADTRKVEAPKTRALAIDTPAADVSAIDASAAPAPRQSAPNESAASEPAAKGPDLAALEVPDEKLPPRPVEASSHPNEIVGPKTQEVYDALGSTDVVDECLVLDICVDRYLWQLYQKTAKEDSIKESTSKKVTIKKKGKLITVTRTTTFVVDEDFGWKDPKAATHASMSLADYVIGGVDRDFKLKLFQMLRAADQAGFAPGITSAFRDDYRQSIASGLKAADNRSYHGGSLRGGYGHGLAADIVSTRGASRKDRLASSEALWKWVDTHGIEFGIGRPYLDRDPPHVAPIDGEEFAKHRPGVKTRQATAQAATEAKAEPKTVAKTDAKTDAKPEAKTEAKTEAKADAK